MTNPVIETTQFGKKLRLLRHRRGQTLQQVSEVLGIHFSHLSRLEMGQKRPSSDLITKASEVFEVSPDQLIKDDLEV